MGGEHHDAVDAHAMALQLPVEGAELLFGHYAACGPIKARALAVYGHYSTGASGEMRARGLAQAVQDVVTVVDRNHVIDDRLTVAIQRDLSLAFIAR